MPKLAEKFISDNGANIYDKVKITNIGKLTKGKGVTVLLDGKKINIKKPGYNHFSE